jgi:hypothetical protein
MAKSKKNPRRLPCTQADVDKARSEGRYEGFNGLMGMFLWVRSEDFGDSHEDLKRTQERVLYYCQEIKDGRLKLADIMSALKEEHDITFELVERRTQ